jgi:hypothetical protein
VREAAHAQRGRIGIASASTVDATRAPVGASPRDRGVDRWWRVATNVRSSTMMALTDRVEPWARRFQRRTAGVPPPEPESARAPLCARRDDDAAPPKRRTGFTRRRGVLQEKE